MCAVLEEYWMLDDCLQNVVAILYFRRLRLMISLLACYFPVKILTLNLGGLPDGLKAQMNPLRK